MPPQHKHQASIVYLAIPVDYVTVLASLSVRHILASNSKNKPQRKTTIDVSSFQDMSN